MSGVNPVDGILREDLLNETFLVNGILIDYKSVFLQKITWYYLVDKRYGPALTEFTTLSFKKTMLTSFNQYKRECTYF